MGATGATHIRPLKEEKAIEVGAEIIGEAFIYSVAASFIMYEYWRSSRKEATLEAEQDREIDVLQDKLRNMEQIITEIESRILRLEKSKNNMENETVATVK